jgi:ATP-dependent Lhr-like helicase
MESAFRYLDAPPPAATVLEQLPPALAAWFRARFGKPTVVQRLAWPALARGDHALVSAPTGTGKTLAALVPVLGQLLTSAEPDGWSDSALRVVYVAPLKALVNDAARGLDRHLEDLAPFLPPQTRLPRPSVRTGDTTAAERRRLTKEPPDLLLTTPESLAVLLSHPSAAALFANVGWVIVDEVHALAGNKRGADLSLSLERLAAGGEVRRVGLSATATPLDAAARWLVGRDRSCAVVRAPGTPPPALRLEPLPEGGKFFASLVERLAAELPRHRAVLVFANTRALAERLSWALRRRLPEWDGLIAVHHSAVAAERREEVESRLKNGRLRAVVSSTSLELGIDVGTVDLAVLVHPPGDVVRLLQRIGRAGHEPGGLRQGLLLTASAAELLECTVTSASGKAGQCEPLTLPCAPLDVLCQQVLGMCSARSWPADDLYATVTRAAPYADLTRRDFDDCLAYLRGLDGRGEPWLPARLREDGDCWRVQDARTARLLRRNLGTILAERGVAVVTCPADDIDEATPHTRAIGEIDESFADRLQPGDRFLLDGRCLEYRRREEGAAVVEEVVGRPRTPRWAGSGWPLSAQLARRLYLLRLQAAEALREGAAALERLLGEDYGLIESAVGMLSAYFQEQESVSEIPDAATLLIEGVRQEDDRCAYYLHTPLNRPANDALARVATRRLNRDHGRSASSVVADLGVVLQFRTDLPDPAATVRQVLAGDGFREELDAALADSEALRTRFARVAQTGLMLLRNPEGRQRKVGGSAWPERRLFEQVRAHDADFVLVRQALREVREEICDAGPAAEYATRLPALTVRCRWLGRPSPFASAWTQSEPGEPDRARTAAEALARLHEELTGGAGAGPG